MATYFDKYRGMATGFKYMGWSCSGLLFPKLLSFFQREYGLKWTFLLYGAISIHGTAFVLLLREPDWIKKETKLGEHRRQEDNWTPMEEAAKENSSGSKVYLPVSRKKGDRWDTWRLFRMPMFHVILACTAWSQYSGSVLQTTMVDYVMDKGSSREKAENFIVYISASGLAGRLLLPVLADTRYLRRSTLVMACFLLLGVATFLLVEVTVYSHCLCIYLLASLLFGCIATMKGVLMADYLGVQHMSACFGFGGLAMVPLMFIDPYINGE